jgi:hypothetical protein
VRILAIALLLALIACNDGVVVQTGLTGIRLTLRYDGAAGIDQFELSGTTEGGSPAFADGRVPEAARPLTEGENTIVILLPDELAGERINLRAAGLAGGIAVATGSTSVMPVLAQLVEASATLIGIEECDEVDADGDGIDDCNDTCLDADGDKYGTAGGAGNACSGLDCDEGVAACNADCSADSDGDGARDCDDRCIDPDGDGYGVGGTATSTCTGADCNEGTATCNVDCNTDADMDGTIDCLDM